MAAKGRRLVTTPQTAAPGGVPSPAPSAVPTSAVGSGGEARPAVGTSRKRRGRETERALAAWLRANGFRYAEPVGSGTPGRDITGLPGLAVEAKARRAFSPLAWVRQARRNAGPDLPIVVLRPDGMGEASVADWPAMLPLSVLVELLRAAGYGDGAA